MGLCFTFASSQQMPTVFVISRPPWSSTQLGPTNARPSRAARRRAHFPSQILVSAPLKFPSASSALARRPTRRERRETSIKTVRSGYHQRNGGGGPDKIGKTVTVPLLLASPAGNANGEAVSERRHSCSLGSLAHLGFRRIVQLDGASNPFHLFHPTFFCRKMREHSPAGKSCREAPGPVKPGKASAASREL